MADIKREMGSEDLPQVLCIKTFKDFFLLPNCAGFEVFSDLLLWTEAGRW